MVVYNEKLFEFLLWKLIFKSSVVPFISIVTKKTTPRETKLCGNHFNTIGSTISDLKGHMVNRVRFPLC